ncbi:MAG: 5-formyltetrahydrofolate cyclo-ligase [Pseudobdellovibrio sp.]
MSDNIRSLKEHLRKEVRVKTLSFSDDVLLTFSSKIQDRIIKFVSNYGLQKWGVFSFLKSEPQIKFQEIAQIKCCYPKVHGLDLSFYEEPLNWQTSSINIREPSDGLKIHNKDDMFGIFVPALAFSDTGVRLGRGQGFYDRFLADYKGLKIGLSYQTNILNHIPHEQHDVVMDYIITEEQVLKVNPEKPMADQCLGSGFQKTGDN